MSCSTCFSEHPSTFGWFVLSGKILALCDTEEEYAQYMTEYLRSHKEIPWEIHTYTEIPGLVEFAEREPVELLVVAENAYTQEVRKLKAARTILLNESGLCRWNAVRNVNKYQQAENVYREIVDVYMEVAGVQLPRLMAGMDVRFIGMYSPVRRCLQTSFALTLGQMLAEKHRTLYLNFEHYAGITELLPDLQTRDLADLVFFLTSDQDRFMLRMQTMLRKKGELDYIPPVKAGQNLLTITPGEWQNLMERIAQLGDYEYVILDLSENIQGLFDMLRLCSRVFTLTKEDAAASSKINQYEQVLSLYEYEDVLEKTHKYNLPLFRHLPDQIEQYTRGELADYVRGVIAEVTA